MQRPGWGGHLCKGLGRGVTCAKAGVGGHLCKGREGVTCAKAGVGGKLGLIL